MKRSGTLKGLLAVLGMVLLILDAKTALRGASDGMAACIETVIPSLFPFILLSCWLNDTVANGDYLIPEWVTRAAGLPKRAGAILISSVLGGYPAGAQAVYQAYIAGALEKKDAERILAYTNNAGPAFIFGMVGHLFSPRAAPWLLWGIHILSAFIVRLLLGAAESRDVFYIHRSKQKNEVILKSSKVICTICAWVITFRIIITYMANWLESGISPALRTVIFGCLELVNGCCSLSEVTEPGMRFIICSGMLAFGGLCVMMQTVSVVHDINIGYFFLGKLAQTVLSLILSTALVYRKWYLLALILVPVFVFILRNKNKCGNPVPIRV